MRGTGGADAKAAGGPAGRGAVGAAVGALAEIAGGTPAAGTCTAGGGVAGRTGELTGDDEPGKDEDEDTAGGATTGRAGITGAAGGAVTKGATVGLVGGGTTAAGLSAGACAAGTDGRGGAGGAPASLRCVIAFNTSPGREMLERSILVLISSSPRSARELDLLAVDEPSAEERRYTRTFSASCSSRELECVFFSVTPTTGSVSRIALLLTSSSRARSLIRTLLIRPFRFSVLLLGHHCDLTESVSSVPRRRTYPSAS
jgi:hypothetical protein